MFSLSRGDWLGIAGIAFGVGVPVWLYLKAEKRTRLSFSIKETILIGSQSIALPDGIIIFYQKKVIADLKKANVFFWNSGTNPIRGGDIASKNPLSINFLSGPQLLRSRIEKVSDYASDVTLVTDDEGIKLSFDYLEPGQGFVVELLYAGKDALAKPDGKIVGMSGDIREISYIATTPVIYLVAASSLGFLSGIIIGIFISIRIFFSYLSDSGLLPLVWSALAVSIFSAVIYMMKILRKRSRSDIPDDLMQ